MQIGQTISQSGTGKTPTVELHRLLLRRVAVDGFNPALRADDSVTEIFASLRQPGGLDLIQRLALGDFLALEFNGIDQNRVRLLQVSGSAEFAMPRNDFLRRPESFRPPWRWL